MKRKGPYHFNIKEYFGIAVLLLIALSLFFYDVVFLNKTFKVTTSTSQALYNGVYGQENNKPSFIPVNGTDAALLEEPVWAFIKNNLKKGILPLWNPHQACGFPLIGMIEIGLFYPLHLILLLLPENFAWDVLILSRFFVAGFLTYIFLRQIRLKKLESLTGAIVFMCSGPMVSLQYWTVNVDILLPLILITTEKLLKAPRFKSVVMLAVSVGLTFFAGHPEHIFFVNGIGFLYFCFRGISLKKFKQLRAVEREKNLHRPPLTAFHPITHNIFTKLFLGYTLGITLSAVVLVPFLYNLKDEFWHGHPPLTGLTTGEVRHRIITLALPFFFQRVPLTFDWEFAGWWGGYLGLLPITLSMISLFNRHKKGSNYFFFILAFLMVAKSYSFSFINWVGYLPIFETCRYYIHTPHLVAFCIAVSSAMGLRTIRQNTHIFPKSLFLLLTLISIILINLYLVRHTDHFPISKQAAQLSFIFIFLLGGVLWLNHRLTNKQILFKKILLLSLVCLISFELFCYIHRGRVNRLHSFPQTPYIEYLKKDPLVRTYGLFGTLYPNTSTAVGIDDFGIFFSLLPKRFVTFINTLVRPGTFANDLRPPALRTVPIVDQGQTFLNLLNVGYLAMPNSERMRRFLLNFDQINFFKEPIYSKEVNLYKRPQVFPRAFIVHKAIFEPNDEESLNKLKHFQLLLNKIAIINAPVDKTIQNKLHKSSLTDVSSAHISSYQPNNVTINTQLTSDGLLILSDNYHPEWTVRVNGQKKKLLRVNYLIRGVFLEKGTHHVEFSFQPTSFYIGIFLSLLSIGILVFLWKQDRRRS